MKDTVGRARRPRAGWGGWRPGAGRKPKGERALEPHAPRAPLDPRWPVHVLLRIESRLPSLRGRARSALEQALAAGRERDGFRLVRHVLQRDHVHLLVEANDGVALEAGVKGLAVRIARALNRAWRRSGRVFADRYHARSVPRRRGAARADPLGCEHTGGPHDCVR